MTPHHIYKYSWIDEKKRGSMSGTYSLKQDHDEAGQYEIRIHGHLDGRWTSWFEGLTLTLEENGDTLISGRVIDQAALFGLLRKVPRCRYAARLGQSCHRRPDGPMR